MQRKFGPQVQLRVVAVGKDPGLVDSFLRNERLTAHIIRMEESEYTRQFNGGKLPALYVVRGGIISDAMTDSTWLSGDTARTRSLTDVVASALRSAT